MARSPTADPALETFTMSEIARVLHVSTAHAYRMAQRGELPGAFHLGRAVRVNKGAFLAWQARLAAAAEAHLTPTGERASA